MNIDRLEDRLRQALRERAASFEPVAPGVALGPLGEARRAGPWTRGRVLAAAGVIVVVVGLALGGWLLASRGGTPSVVTPSGSPATAHRSGGAKHLFVVVPVLAQLGTPASPAPAPGADAAAVRDVTSCAAAQDPAIQGAVDVPTTPWPPVHATDCQVLRLRNQTLRALLAPIAGNATLGTPAGVTARDVLDAKSVFAGGQGYTVQLALTASGSAKLNAMAAAGFDRATPRNLVAIVIDGLVYAEPAFQNSSFSGPVQITGNFTAQQAARLAADINLARSRR